MFDFIACRATNIKFISIDKRINGKYFKSFDFLVRAAQGSEGYDNIELLIDTASTVDLDVNRSPGVLTTSNKQEVKISLGNRV
jgi:hypothetical protein